MVQACSQAENDQHSEHIVWRLRRRAEDGTLGLYSRVVRAIRKISMVSVSYTHLTLPTTPYV